MKALGRARRFGRSQDPKVLFEFLRVDHDRAGQLAELGVLVVVERAFFELVEILLVDDRVGEVRDLLRERSVRLQDFAKLPPEPPE